MLGYQAVELKFALQRFNDDYRRSRKCTKCLSKNLDLLTVQLATEDTRVGSNIPQFEDRTHRHGAHLCLNGKLHGGGGKWGISVNTGIMNCMRLNNTGQLNQGFDSTGHWTTELKVLTQQDIGQLNQGFDSTGQWTTKLNVLTQQDTGQLNQGFHSTGHWTTN